jgi:hypothetical protein
MSKKWIITIIMLFFLIDRSFPQGNWEAEIAVQGEDEPLLLKIGGHTSGTDLFDVGLDLLAPPPPPSDYYAYFEIADPTFNSLAKDIRGWLSPYDTDISWTLEIKNADDIETTVTWDSSDLPAEGFFTLIDSIMVDMRTNTSFTFTGNRTVYLTYSMSGYALLSLNIFIKGPYDADSDNMTTYLQTGELIPTTSPYDDSREVSPIPSGITDWIFVELRDAADGDALTLRSFFLRNDGMVTGDDGTTTELTFPVTDGDYFIVIRHRNHLAVMSAAAQSLNSTSATLYDFTTGSGQFYGGASGAQELETDVWGMIAGDANGNGVINSTDYIFIRNSVGSFDYSDYDCNLNGVVNSTDYLVVRPNIGAQTSVPE